MFRTLRKLRGSKLAVCISAVVALAAPGTMQAQTMPANLDFGSSNFSNWSSYVGYSIQGDTTVGVYFSNSLTGVANNGILTSAAPPRHTITSGSGTDAYGGFPVVAPGGGLYSAKLGFDSVMYRSERIRYQIHVPSGIIGYNLQCKFAIVLNDGQHTKDIQAKYQVVAYDSATGSVIPYANNLYIVGFLMPGFIQHTTNPYVWYLPWKSTTINLSNMGGRTVTLEVTAQACGAGGHWGYGYFDVTGISNYLAPTPTACNLTNNTISFNAPPGYGSYRWYNQNFSTALNGPGDTNTHYTLPLPSTAQYYNLILYPLSSIGVPDTVRTNILSTTIAVSASSTSVCASGVPVQLTASATGGSGGYTYQWYGDTASLSGTRISNPIARPTLPSHYYVKVMDTNGCFRMDTINMRLPGYTANAGADTTVCYGDAVTLNATVSPATSGYTYTWSPASNLSTTSGANPTYTSFVAGTQQLVLEVDSSGCIVHDTINITTRGGSFLTRDTAVCRGVSFIPKMQGDTAMSFSWTPATNLTFPSPAYSGSDQRPTYLADSTRTFTISGQYAGCPPVTKQLTVTVNSNPAVNVSTPSGSTCVAVGDSVHLQTSVTGTGGIYTYQWTGNTGSLSAVNIPNPWAKPVGPNIYFLKVTDSNGCSGRDTLLLRNSSYTINAGHDTTLCYGSTLRLHATTSLPGNYSYTWTPGTNLSSTSVDTPLYAPVTAGIQQFILQVDSFGSCSMYDTIRIRTLPNTFAVADTTVCAGTNVVPYVMGDTAFTYTWTPTTGLTFPSPAYSGSDQHPTVVGDTTKTYTITAQYPGCTSISQQLTVTVEPVPVVTLVADTMYKSPAASISITSSVSPTWYTNYTYQWPNTSSIDSVNNPGIYFSGSADTSLVLTVSTPHGCTGTDTVVVIINYLSMANVVTIPNAFAPGGVNSRFSILRIAPGHTLKSFRVYSRWGKKVFETSDPNASWDGTFNGSPAPMGAYAFVVETVSSKGQRAITKGSVTLIR